MFHADEGIVTTILRSGDTKLLETTELQGLVQLDRIEQGRRKTYRPKTDLKPFSPVKVGKKLVAEFEVEESGKKFTSKIEYDVQKADTLYIGGCKYDVFQIQKSDVLHDRAPRFLNSDYYSPILKIVIAKEYRNSNGTTTWIKYDRITPADR